MKFHSNQHFHPAIKEARRKERAAKSELRRVLREVQTTCPHTEVVEAPYRRSEWVGSMPAQRTCRVCGLTEYSRYGSATTSFGRWGPLTEGPCSMDPDYSRKPVLTTEFAKAVSRDEIKRYQCR